MIFRPISSRLALGCALFAATPLLAQLPRGLLDHSLCCGPKANVDGGAPDEFSDPGYDPMLRRNRVTPSKALRDTTPDPTKIAIPGTDSFVRETPRPTAPTPPPTTATTPQASLASAEIAAPATTLATTPPAPEPPRTPLVAPTEKVQGHLRVGFEVLGGFDFQLSKDESLITPANEGAAIAKATAQIPDLIRQLDGQKVLVRGFMLPMKMEGPLATEVLLVANSLLCCYGVVPPMNQWMTVKLKAGVKPQQDVPMQFFGTLRVQPRIDNGALSAIYHLDADKTYEGK